MFKKILIANRGEIACRIIKTAKRLGITSIAIYSDIDKNSLHTKMADKAFCVGPAPSQESYLNINNIIKIAKENEIDAIHPGYGFLSENAEFAKACNDADITFIGPSIDAIHSMGSKNLAKKIMEKAKVPIIPGYHGDDQSLEALQKAAKKIAYPILLKAAAGGGGKGMRLVEKEKDFQESFYAAKREALKSFADDTLIVEKYIKKPRHIEFQIFADNKGNVVHLFERECSIQRRHQKIIEEAPAPKMTADLREKMAKAAINAAKTIKYVGAGTIEFLVDDKNNFYFMEMNTRLQVEHPITEMITGIDLVEWQLLIASGGELPLTQKLISMQGQAIEARIYAENPYNNFLPSTGTIDFFQAPTTNDQVRLDTGVEQNSIVSMHYDPMLAKLICYAETRQTAINSLQQALKHFYIAGLTTNVDFLSTIVQHEQFQSAEISTHFIEKNHAELFYQEKPAKYILALACLYLLLKQRKNFIKNSNDHYSPWQINDSWQLNLAPKQKIHLTADKKNFVIDVIHKQNFYEITIDKVTWTMHGKLRNSNHLEATINNQQFTIVISHHNNYISIFGAGPKQILQICDDIHCYAQQEQLSGQLTAPMPGTVVAIMTQSGAKVQRGDSLIVIEAMKMEHTLHAPSSGIVKKIHFAVGDQVNEGIELIAFESN